MGFRLTISKLASADARAGAGRVLAVMSVLGFVLTMVVVLAAGGRLEQWFFIFLVWALFIYVPLRILLEAGQTIAPTLRRRLITEAAGRPERYATRSSRELMVDALFDREVVMPRIATPVQTAKAKDGAVAVLGRASLTAGLRTAAAVCLAAVDLWTADLGGRATREAPQNIQARWAEVRALAALAAMTRVLIASYGDRAGAAFAAGDGGVPNPAQFLDACLDYCDDLALDVDVAPWDGRPLSFGLDPERARDLRRRWQTFCDTSAPALEARQSFVDVLFTASPRPAPPTAS